MIIIALIVTFKQLWRGELNPYCQVNETPIILCLSIDNFWKMAQSFNTFIATLKFNVSEILNI